MPLDLKDFISTQIMKGTIKKIMDKGFGFISREDNGEDLFFHSTDVIGSFTDLREGDEVTFELGESDKGNGLKGVEVTKA